MTKRIQDARTYGEVKTRLSESEKLNGIEQMPNGTTRYHGPTGMVSVHGPDQRKVKFNTVKQIILLAVKAGLLIIVLVALWSILF